MDDAGLDEVKQASQKFEVADQRIVTSQGYGSIGNKLKTVHVVPSFGANLMSMIQLYRDGKATLFHPTYGIMIAEAKDMHVTCSKPLCVGYIEGNSFKVDIKVPPGISLKTKSPIPKAHITRSRESRIGTPTLEERASLWLRRLGLASPQRIIDAVDHDLVTGISLPKHLSPAVFKTDAVEAYNLAKSKAQPHRDLNMKKTAKAPFELIHVDTEVVNCTSYGGAIYRITCVCDYSRYKMTRAFDKKSQVVAKVQEMVQEIELMGFNVKRVRWDNGSEQKNYKMKAWLEESRIRPEFTSTYSSASNGVAERSIQTIRTTSNALRISARLPKKAWAECDRTAVFLENRLPCRANAGCESPYELVTNRKPDLSFLRVIGCKCYVHIHKPQRGDKLDPRAKLGVLLGYGEYTKGYRILLDPTRGEIIETMHVTFNERAVINPSLGHFESSPEYETAFVEIFEGINDEPSVQGGPAILEAKASDLAIKLQAHNDDDQAHIILPDDLVPFLDSGLLPSDHPRYSEVDESNIIPGQGRSRRQVRRVQAVQGVSNVRLSYVEAKKDPLLVASMLDELKTLFSSGAAKVVDLPPGRKPIKAIWVHKFKFDKDGQFTRARSRVCPQGFRQIAGVDYDPDEVAAPTLSLETAMLSLSIEVRRNQFTLLVDVDKAFMIPKPKMKIYCAFPDGMTKIEGKVLEINSLQGTKQGAYDWHELAREHLIQTGFNISKSQPCYFYKWDGECFSQVRLYVDDFRISSDTEEMLNKYRDSLDKGKGGAFPVKVLPGDHWLGMSIDHHREAGLMYVSLKSYIAKALEEYGMVDCTPQKTPAEPKVKLIKPSEGVIDLEALKFPYRSLLGTLLWLARTGRPDITYAVNQLQQFCNSWDSTHVTAAKRILRYLKGSIELKMTFRRGDGFTLAAYADSDFAAEPEGNDYPMRSISGLVAYIHGVGPIFSSAVLEKTISLSTAEAEYKCVAKAAQFCIGIRQFLDEIGFPQKDPTIIMNDNMAAVTMVKQDFSSSSTRHIKIKFHLIREAIKNEEVRVLHRPTEEMIADIMTKALERVKFEHFREILLNSL
jgi:transposase InsO family protein